MRIWAYAAECNTYCPNVTVTHTVSHMIICAYAHTPVRTYQRNDNMRICAYAYFPDGYVSDASLVGVFIGHDVFQQNCRQIISILVPRVHPLGEWFHVVL